MKEYIIYASMIVIMACNTHHNTFDEISDNSTVDSIKFYDKYSRITLIIENTHIGYICNGLRSSKGVNRKEMVKLPPYSGILDVFSKGSKYTYKIYGDAFITRNQSLYISSINIGAYIAHILEQKDIPKRTEDQSRS